MAPKMVKLTINGREVEVREGTNLVDAAELIGVEVPHYCYHAGLSAPANCRICQCEVEGAPKLVFGCRTPVKEGMVVKTDSPKAKAAQQLVQEFLLCNHPLDCPICDKAGECTLQNYYMDYGQYQPVMIENKYKKHKANPIGPTIVLDTERCILCSRCVRFCDEVTGTSELGLFNRNNHTEIGVVPGQVLDNAYSGNLVDICPVGALGDRDFRFKCRVWYLQHTKSICPGCSKGCNITVDWQTRRKHIAEGARIMRLRPRFNEAVNGHWMCDDGRYGYGWHDENRITAAAVKRDGAQVEAVPREAFDAAVSCFKSSDRASWTVLLSTFLSNEELFLARTLFAEGLGVRVVVGPPTQGPADKLLRRADKSPNTAGARALGLTILDEPGLAALKGNIWSFSYDLLSRLNESTNQRTLLFDGPNACPTSMAADVVLPAATCFEKDGTFTNEDNRVQHFAACVTPLGDAEPGVARLQRLGAALGVALPAGGAADVFDALAAREPAFAGLSHEALGDNGAVLVNEGVTA